MNTLATCLHKLKTQQQVYIVSCVREYMRKDFHRGILPFLTVEDAIRVLKRRREGVKRNYAERSKRDPAYCTRIISILSEHTDYALHPDEVHTVMHLADWKLADFFGRRYSKKFCAYTTPQEHIKDESMSMVQLEKLGRNKWKMTCHPDVQHLHSTWLASQFLVSIVR